jgi:hypothetical protein
MNGVEILSSTEVASEYALNETAFWIAFGITLCVIMLMGIIPVVNGECEWPIILLCFWLGLAAGGIMGAAAGGIMSTPVAYETQYKVTIDDSVSLNEFLDKYEIIDQEGKIYTVREKE